MNGTSKRLRQAVVFLKKNGHVRFEADIARKLGVTPSTLNMAIQNYREPTIDLLVRLCDNYPISLDWLRTGEGGMIKGEKELAMLKRIEELEARIRELEGK